MDGARYTKRTRQACEPCRRKKSRCPGERPVCSYCQRLGQRCVYNLSGPVLDPPAARHDRKMEHRIDSLEGKMDRLIQQLSPVAMASRQSAEALQLQQNPQPLQSEQPPLPMANEAALNMRSSSIDNTSMCGMGEISNGNISPELNHVDVSQTELLVMGRLYLTWCHGQPVTLFTADTFLESLSSRDRELILALQTFSLRFPPRDLTPQKRDRLDTMEKEARSIVMSKIADAQVELSTLQALCILSMVEFANGKVAQAGLNLALASNLAQCVQPDNMLGDPQEFSDCVRSIIMLQNLQGLTGASPSPFESMFGERSLLMGQSQITAGSILENPGFLESSVPCQMDAGIMRCVAELSQAWRMARAYAASRVEANASPPWSRQSDYSSVMQVHLEFDCRVPLRYRFAANKFETQDQQSLEQRRHYWGPWLFIQIVYSVIPCLLNHPFLLSMRLRSFRNTIPQSFIHQSFEYINRHAGWIVYFIHLLEKKSYYVPDPAIAHCIAIVATIHLQHSFVQDQSFRDRAQKGFEKCMSFLRRMGGTWPSVATMASNLAKLKESVVVVQTPDRDGGNGQRSFSIDAQLLWDILVYERAGRPDAGADQSIFGKTLYVGTASRDEDVRAAAEYDLVGSEGIYGHKAVSKESLAYAPNEDMATPAAGEIDPMDEMAGMPPDMGVSVEDRYFEGIGGIDSLDGQDHLFLQAHDFGKAIDNWLSRYSL